MGTGYISVFSSFWSPFLLSYDSDYFGILSNTSHLSSSLYVRVASSKDERVLNTIAVANF